MVKEKIVDQQRMPDKQSEITELFESLTEPVKVSEQEKIEMYEYELQIPIKK